MPKPSKKGLQKIIPVDNTENSKFMLLYNKLDPRDRNLVDSLAIGVPLANLYSEYFTPGEFGSHFKNALYRGQNDRDIAKFAKEKLVSDVITKHRVGEKTSEIFTIAQLVAERRRMHQDIIIETFRKRALETCITREFVANELLKLRERINTLDTEKQIKYELQLLTLIEKSISSANGGDKTTTNIQINNNIPI